MDQLLTKSEQKVFDLLLQRSDSIVPRDDIAKAVWGPNWLDRYSDWEIDRLIYLIRHKLPTKYSVKTLRNSGYILLTTEKTIPNFKLEKVEGILPTKDYLEYMNNTKNPRKVLSDLFKTIEISQKFKKILVINSYSYDNVDTMAKKYPDSEVFFSNFDKRALKIHEDRINELKLSKFRIDEDDIRKSIFNNNLFDLVINDFRLNFNTSDKQNIDTINNIYRILKPNGKSIISVVISPSSKTIKQSKHFVSEENLVRPCYSVEYYKKLFTKQGFLIEKEFDQENGKKWNPPYARFILHK